MIDSIYLKYAEHDVKRIERRNYALTVVEIGDRQKRKQNNPGGFYASHA